MKKHPGFEFKIQYCERKLYKTKLILPYSREEIIAEMLKEDWRPFTETNTTGDDQWALRLKLISPKSPVLQSIKYFFNDDETRADLIDAIFPNGMRSDYGMPKDALIKNTYLGAEFTIDRPGFQCGRHLDFRLLVATGLQSLMDEDDPKLATYFYKSNDPSEEPYERCSMAFGDGWMQINGHDVWHDGGNDTDQDRYSMLIALTLRTEHPTN